jgi:hypothetical protein
MPRGKKSTAEQIIGKLREAEVELSRRKKVPEMCRKLGVTEQTYDSFCAPTLAPEFAGQVLLQFGRAQTYSILAAYQSTICLNPSRHGVVG